MTICYFTATGNCLHNCPQHAIHMPLEAGTTQFRNEHVTLEGHHPGQRIAGGSAT